MVDSQGLYRPLAPLACVDATDSTLAERAGELIVVNKLAGLVQFYGAADHLLRGEITMEPFPHEVVIEPAGHRAFVSIYGRGVFGRNSEAPGRTIAIIDLATRSLAGSIDVSPWRGPHGMAFDAAGVLWVSCDVSGVILAVDTHTHQVLAALETGSFGTHWLVTCHRHDKLYASNKIFDFLCVVDTERRCLATRIPFPEGSEGLALTPDGERLFVTAQRPQMMAVIDTATDQIIERVPLDVFAPTPADRNPQKRVRLSPDGAWVLVSSFSTGEIAVAPSHDLHAMTRITVEKGPMGITFIDAGTACVMNHDQGSISVVDVRRGVVIDRFETAAGPETLALF